MGIIGEGREERRGEEGRGMKKNIQLNKNNLKAGVLKVYKLSFAYLQSQEHLTFQISRKSNTC